ncbi:MAG: hypothetical protein B6I28_01665 [Fusobacteriia bacterium 4572_132]|nr:MAG: hypothetical protein B6I28_01665 [Fusobacteriia bacterium 4572_132]
MKGLSYFFEDKIKKIYLNEVENKIEINKKEIRVDLYYPKVFDIYENNIYITDSYNNQIKVINFEGELIRKIGEGNLSEPFGIKCYQKKIYIVNKDKGKIAVYNLKGTFQFEFPLKMKLPTFLEIHNGEIYVVDTNDNKIYVFDTKGNIIKSIENNFNYPLGIKVTQNYIYLADQYNKRVLKLSKDGIIIEEVLKGEYYSLLNIKENELIAYDEKNGIFVKKEISDRKINLEEFLKNNNRMKELAYYHIKKGEINNGIEILKNKEYWDASYKKENLKIADKLAKKEFYEFLLKHYEKKEYIYKKVLNKDYFFRKGLEIKNYPEIDFKNPKAIYRYKEDLWVSLFKSKLLLRIDEENRLKEVNQINNQIDKFIITETEIILLDYYYRNILVLDKKKLKEKRKIKSKEIKNPVDIKLVKNDLLILDSESKKVFVFNLSGRKLKEYKISGRELVALYYRNKKYYILDKKKTSIYIYDEFFVFEKEVLIKVAEFPDDIVVDKNNNIYISDEGKGRLLKLDKNGNFIFEELEFIMPRDLLLEKNEIYISDFGGNKIIKYVME